MAINPMQRRARNSFITGLIVGLVITVIVAGLLLLQNNKTKSELNSERKKQVSTYVAARDIKANSKITGQDLVAAKVITELIPDSIVTPMYLESSAPSDNTKVGLVGGKQNKLMAEQNPIDALINTASSEGQGEQAQQNQQQPVNNAETPAPAQPQPQTQSTPTPTTQPVDKNEENADSKDSASNGFVAGIDIPKGSIITKDMLISESDSTIENEGNKTLRLAEYTSITLPSQLAEGDTIDIRLRLKTGQDFLVITKKQVVKTDLTTVWLKVNEEEISRMASAIIESYFLEGAKLYAVNYVRPGTQAKAIPTYPVRPEVIQSLGNNKNIPQKIKEQLNIPADSTRETINRLINASLETGDSSVKSKVDEEIKKQQENREKYLEALTGEVEK